MSGPPPKPKPAEKKAAKRQAYEHQATRAASVYRKAMGIHRSIVSRPFDGEPEAAVNALNIALRALEHMTTLTGHIHST